MAHARVGNNGVRWSMLEYERVVLGGACYSEKEWY